MSPKFSHLGLVLVLSLTTVGNLLAQAVPVPEAAKPTGPAAKKADDLIRAYTARIEKEIEQGRKEIDRLRAELHELIDVRYAMADAIADLRGELATKGTYCGDFGVPAQPAPKPASAPQPAPTAGMQFDRDFFYGLGSTLPAEPTAEQREQLRRLAPRADLKRMIEGLRAEVDVTRVEIDRLAYKLLELRAGIPATSPAMGGGMLGGVGGPNGQWFGTMGMTLGGMM